MAKRGRKPGSRNRWLQDIGLLFELSIVIAILGNILPPWFWYVVAVLALVIVAWWLWRIFRYRNLKIAGIDKMAGKEFETYVAWLLRRQGYRVEEIGGYEDMGVDLVATNTKGIRHAIQVKCWNAREVDMNAVRAAIAGVAIHNCQRAVVITNNYFTRKAKELAEANNCKLIDRDTLADQINRLQSSALQLTEEANQ